jgi:hypothetical protein
MLSDVEYVEIAAQDLMKRLNEVRREAASRALEDAARWQDRECARAVEEDRLQEAQLHADVAAGLRKRAADEN